MKLLTVALLALSTAASFAQGAPKLTLNDEQFREVIELSLTKSPTVANLNENASIVAEAAYANRTCSLKLEIISPNLSLNSSFSITSKNLDKCKAQISKYIIKNI